MELRYPQSDHEREIIKIFSGEVIAEMGTRPLIKSPVILCFTNRCGSGYLSELLRSTGCVSGLGECLNHDEVSRQSIQHGCSSFPNYLECIRKKQQNRGSQWGFKAGWMQLAYLLRWKIIPNQMFAPHFIYLTRHDRLSQAVSYNIALQTDCWQKYGNSSPNQGSAEPVFRPKVALDFWRSLLMADRWFEELFLIAGVVPIRVVYEDLLDNPHREIGRITERLGHGVVAPHVEGVTLQRQRERLNLRHRSLLKYEASQTELLAET